MSRCAGVEVGRVGARRRVLPAAGRAPPRTGWQRPPPRRSATAPGCARCDTGPPARSTRRADRAQQRHRVIRGGRLDRVGPRCRARSGRRRRPDPRWVSGPSQVPATAARAATGSCGQPPTPHRRRRGQAQRQTGQHRRCRRSGPPRASSGPDDLLLQVDRRLPPDGGHHPSAQIRVDLLGPQPVRRCHRLRRGRALPYHAHGPARARRRPAGRPPAARRSTHVRAGRTAAPPPDRRRAVCVVSAPGTASVVPSSRTTSTITQRVVVTGLQFQRQVLEAAGRPGAEMPGVQAEHLDWPAAAMLHAGDPSRRSTAPPGRRCDRGRSPGCRRPRTRGRTGPGPPRRPGRRRRQRAARAPRARPRLGRAPSSTGRLQRRPGHPRPGCPRHPHHQHQPRPHPALAVGTGAVPPGQVRRGELHVGPLLLLGRERPGVRHPPNHGAGRNPRTSATPLHREPQSHLPAPRRPRGVDPEGPVLDRPPVGTHDRGTAVPHCRAEPHVIGHQGPHRPVDADSDLVGRHRGTTGVGGGEDRGGDGADLPGSTRG